MSTLELTVQSGLSLRIHHFSIRESMSELFEIALIAHIDQPDVDLEAIVGLPATFRIVAGYSYAKNLGTRCWKGMIRFAEQSHAQSKIHGLSTYYLQIVPELYKLTQRTNYRIFQHLSIPDIVKLILGEWGIEATWEIDVGACPKLEYKVQYAESDYAFVSRLLEEAGIAFVFRDPDGAGTVFTMSDRLQAGTPRAPLPFVDNPSEAAQKEFLSQLRLAHEVRPGAYVLRDYDFRNPAFRSVGEAPIVAGPESAYEQYRYAPGAFLVEGARGGGTPVADDKGKARHDVQYGTSLATRRLQSIRADKRHVTFVTNAVDLAPGMLFTVEDHPNPALGTSTRWLATALMLDGTPDGEWTVTGHAVSIDPTLAYRPPVKSPKPRVFGVQSATVTGPPGQEIYTDEFGRVRVQFPWDREGKNDDNSSCWMRVGQGWAGLGYGMTAIPRIGQEVLVTFLDGDPDRPIITGRVHNEVQQVPYRLPENMTVSAWRTQSSPATGGYNEIKFEDKAGRELVYHRAERDLHKLVRRNEVERTMGDKMSTVNGTEDNVVTGDRKTLLESNEHLHVKMDQHIAVDGSQSLSVRVDHLEKVGKRHAVEAQQEIHLKAGQTLVLEAGARLTIKAAGGFIDIHSGGIDIVGILVNVNSGGSAGMGQGANPTAPTDASEAIPTDTPV